MGISRLSAMVIQSNEVIVEPYKGTNDLYGFYLTRMENGNHRIIVSTQPTFTSEEIAKTSAEDLIKEIREMKL